MSSHAISTARFVHGIPRAARRRRVRRNRALVLVTLVALLWSGRQLWPGTVEAAVAAVQGSADEHAPTGSDSLDGLEPAMLGSVEAALDAAAAAGVRIEIVSAHRDAAEQQLLFDRAVTRYGSKEAARAWVLPPDESEHVQGGAIDVAPRAAGRWLEKHGVEFGLCRRYVNEWWHFERLAGPAGATCPPMEAHAGL